MKSWLKQKRIWELTHKNWELRWLRFASFNLRWFLVCTAWSSLRWSRNLHLTSSRTQKKEFRGFFRVIGEWGEKVQKWKRHRGKSKKPPCKFYPSLWLTSELSRHSGDCEEPSRKQYWKAQVSFNCYPLEEKKSFFI